MEVKFGFKVSSGKLPTVMAFNLFLTIYSFHICSLVSLLPVNLLEQGFPIFSGAQGGTWQCTGGGCRYLPSQQLRSNRYLRVL